MCLNKVFTALFVSEKLKKYFKQYGNVQDAVVMKDPVSKRSRGFGFITFVDVASVDNALANEPHTIDSRKVNLAPFAKCKVQSARKLCNDCSSCARAG